jgi:hypothetical protein
MPSTKFRYIWPNSFRGEFFFKSANQKQELPVAAMFADKYASKTPHSNELKLGRKHLWQALIAYFVPSP